MLRLSRIAALAALVNLATASTRSTEPCLELSRAFDSLVEQEAPELITDLPPSVGIQCLKSVPLVRDRDLQLLEYLRPYVSFHSTIGSLAAPPETYLIPGVDIWGGFDAIEEKLKHHGYTSQYDVMVDLRSIFVAAADNHFAYFIAMFRQFEYARHGLNMTSLSADGLAVPQVYMAVDVEHGNHNELDYRPSSVVSIDDEPVFDFLSRDATLKIANAQDPDAQYNTLFDSIPTTVAGREGTLTSSQFEIPDQYTIKFHNGSTLIVHNYVKFLPATNFSGIASGQDFQNRFEIPPTDLDMNLNLGRSVEERSLIGKLHRTSSGESYGHLGAANAHGSDADEDDCTEEDYIDEAASFGHHDTTSSNQESDEDDCTEEDEFEFYEGSSRTSDDANAEGEDPSSRSPINYPEPYEVNSYNNLATFFLDTEGFEDIAILSVLSFSPIGIPDDQIDDGEFIHGASLLIEHFIAKARETGRDKLVLDLSANSGGHIVIADELFRLLFPDGEFTSYDRMPANDALDALVHANFSTFNEMILRKGLKPDGSAYSDADDFFGPHAVELDNVTSPFLADRSVEYPGGFYINGFEENPTITEAYFSPENIIIVTDGVCASACTILTGLLTRNYNVRTLALGGRPQHAPMQVMGGTRGTVVHQATHIRAWFDVARSALQNNTTSNEDSVAILQDAAAVLPSSDPPPLMPAPVAAGFAAVNGRNGYAKDDLEGIPFHFQYQAANCRLFYTQRMAYDISEVWRRAAGVAWREELCVDGSTVNDDQTIGYELLPFTEAVRSTAPEVEGPGALGVPS